MKLFRSILLSVLILADPVTLLAPPVAAIQEAFAGVEPAGLSDARQIELLAHDLSVELLPDQHRLLATDRVTLKALDPNVQQVSLSLNATLQVNSIHAMDNRERHRISFTTDKGAGQGKDDGVQWVVVQLPGPARRDQVVRLEWHYEGTIHDPPREPRHLRFVTPSETAGHIGSEGVYLSGETHWYPDLPGSLPTFRVRAATPAGWEAVTHGMRNNRTASDRTVTADWEVTTKTEALTLVANRFVTKQRDWHDQDGRTVQVATYLFPDDAHLADEYLNASVQYLEAYTKLLGPYPFPKFAVVENFFASGLGMPSFTLLGSGVVKRHYVQPYALGHEIVHSWIGNSVLNDLEAGNWVEGLTTYLANYYYDELVGKPEQAREQRRMMLLGYAVYVAPDGDYPVGQFRRKSDQKDNAIGYQKSAMIFHMLRHEIGETAFWSGIRKLTTHYAGVHANWHDLERVFSEAGGKDLRWFFVQWVERSGAPSLSIEEARVQAENSAVEGTGRFVINARLRQTQEQGKAQPYRLRLRVLATMERGDVHATVLEVQSIHQTFTLTVPAQPRLLQIDPDFETFRRLTREHLPPMLNLYVTDRERSVVLPDAGAEADRAPYQALADRVAAQEIGQEQGGKPTVVQATDPQAVTADASVLVLGGPGINRAAGWAIRGCADRVNLEDDRFTVDGQGYEGADMALLVSCRQPERPHRVATLFYGLTARSAAKVARLLFFYGWQSYLVFRDGTVVARGDFGTARNETEVRFDARDR